MACRKSVFGSGSVILDRRAFLLTSASAAGALATGGLAFMPRVTLAGMPVAGARPASGSAGAGSANAGDGRLVFIILRGALDGLSAVPPYGDPDYSRLRCELALGAPGSADGCLRLDGTFGLHPSFGFLHECFGAGELTVFHAVATPYRERSHFDGQDVLENGLTRPHAAQTGWLNRALVNLAPPQREAGVALGQNLPLMMRGPAAVASWSPSRLATLDNDTLQRIADRYAGDPLLSHRLSDALASDAIATAGAESMGGSDAAGNSALLAKAGGRAASNRYAELIHATAGFLRAPDGPRVAVFDTTGWDTHANEGSAEGQLAARLGALDGALRTLKDELGSVWSRTAVMIATEFGRTAATNGTRGTDHGTASAAFLLGGAVRGGRVIADWPGLSPSALYQGRDLRPTTDLRSLLKGVLADQLRVSNRALENEVFPESGTARAAIGLLRG